MNMEDFAWLGIAGFAGLGLAADVAGIAIPAPLDQIVDWPLDMLIIGLALFGVFVA